MKKNYWIVAVIVLTIAIGVYMTTKKTMFEEVGFERLNVMEVSNIEIIRSTDDYKITVIDPSQISLIMKAFSQIKLREINSKDNFNFSESYWIIFKANKIRKFGITLYGNDYVSIFDYSSNKNSSKLYKITNEFDPIVIRSLFQR